MGHFTKTSLHIFIATLLLTSCFHPKSSRVDDSGRSSVAYQKELSQLRQELYYHPTIELLDNILELYDKKLKLELKFCSEGDTPQKEDLQAFWTLCAKANTLFSVYRFDDALSTIENCPIPSVVGTGLYNFVLDGHHASVAYFSGDDATMRVYVAKMCDYVWELVCADAAKDESEYKECVEKYYTRYPIIVSKSKIDPPLILDYYIYRSILVGCDIAIEEFDKHVHSIVPDIDLSEFEACWRCESIRVSNFLPGGFAKYLMEPFIRNDYLNRIANSSEEGQLESMLYM